MKLTYDMRKYKDQIILQENLKKWEERRGLPADLSVILADGTETRTQESVDKKKYAVSVLVSVIFLVLISAGLTYLFPDYGFIVGLFIGAFVFPALDSLRDWYLKGKHPLKGEFEDKILFIMDDNGSKTYYRWGIHYFAKALGINVTIEE